MAYFSLWLFRTTWDSSHIWHYHPKYFYQWHVTIANDSLLYGLEYQQTHWCCHGHLMNNTPAGNNCMATVVITGTVCLVLLTVSQVCTMGIPFEKVKAKGLRQAEWKLVDTRGGFGLSPWDGCNKTFCEGFSCSFCQSNYWQNFNVQRSQ